MKKSKFHTSSFLLGSVVGAVVILLLAMSLPPRTEAQTNQVFENKSNQIKLTTTQKIEKSWNQVRADLSTSSQKTFHPINVWVNQKLA